MCLGLVVLKNCKKTAEKCQQISENWKKTTASQTHSGFVKIGSNMHRLNTTAISNPKISNNLT